MVSKEELDDVLYVIATSTEMKRVLENHRHTISQLLMDFEREIVERVTNITSEQQKVLNIKWKLEEQQIKIERLQQSAEEMTSRMSNHYKRKTPDHSSVQLSNEQL